MEKKRIHPNVIDIIFILLIAAVALVAYFLSHDNADTVQTTPRSYVIKLAEADPAMAQAVAPGDAVVDNVQNYDIGIVTGVETAPCTTPVMDESVGKFVQAEVPDLISMYITIQADTIDGEKQITTASGYVLQVGAEISCAIDDFYAVGRIVSLER